MQRDGPVNLPYPGRRTRRLVVVTKGLFLILLTLLSIAQAIPIHPANASNSPSDQPAGRAALPPTGSISPTAGGAGPVPDLSLPKTVLSNVEKLIGAGGVIQSSKDNITLYNSLLAMRLLGGAFPHDELLGPDRRVVSSYSFWGLETQVGGLWTPLIPVSNSLSQMGTNESGTFVRRTMDVVTGPYGGTFSIIYRADSKGALKWSLGFTPATFSRYRLVYAWWNVTGDYALSSPAKQFRVGYRVANFTMSWGDVPDSYNATTNIQSSRFFLTIDLGKILPGNSILIDPSIVASGVAAGSTSYTFQRKVFYEPKGGYYWVFYFTGTRMNYSSSRDGTSWSLPQSIPSSLYPQGYQGAEFYLAPVYIVGQTVIVASGETAICGVGTVSVRYLVGTISGSSLQWGAVQIADTISGICSGGALGVRYVNVAASSDGYFAFSYNWYMVGDS